MAACVDFLSCVMGMQERTGGGWVLALLGAWHEMTRRRARERRLLARGLSKQAQRRLRGSFRDWVRSHERGKRSELEPRVQRQAEARSAAERRALVSWFFHRAHASAANAVVSLAS